jgi:thiol-disulfide isomerase/thioredoxin
VRGKPLKGALLVLSLTWATPAFAAPAPGFVLESLTEPSLEVSLSDFRGKVVYLDFWAAWCAPCRDALPFFDVLQSEVGTDDLQVIGISIDEDPRDALRFLREVPVRYPVVHDVDGRVLKAYGVETMPTGILIRRDGEIVLEHRGFLQRDKATLRAAVLEAVAGRP